MSKKVARLVEQNTDLVRALEATRSELALQERRLDEVYYLNMNSIPSRDEYVILPQAKKRDVVRRLRILRQENPLAKQAMKLAIRFTLGKGVSFLVKDESSQEAVMAFWDHPINQAVLTSWRAMKERFDEKLTDGEIFIVMAAAPAEPYVELGTFPMEEIDDIIYHPRNRFFPVYYKRVYKELVYDATANDGSGEWKQPDPNSKPKIRYYKDYRVTDEVLADIEGLNIPDSMIEPDHYVYHSFVNPVWTRNGRRGVSELFASREWFRVFSLFMEDRGAINAAANTFSYVRKVKGGASAVASMRGKIGGVPMGADAGTAESGKRLSRPIPGAIYDTNDAVDIAALRADTGAVDAKEDARLILMTGGAGVATNLPYFGEGGDANLATAQAMELPMVKTYEDYQTEIQNDLDEICKFVIRIARGEDVEKEALTIAWDMPPIITRDVVKFTSAWGQVMSQIAPGNVGVAKVAIRGALEAMDVPNIESVWPEIEEEIERVAAEKEEMRQLQLQAGMMVPGAPGAQNGPPGAQKPPFGAQNDPKSGKNGQKPDAGPPATSPDDQRLRKGKPPRIPATGGRLARTRS